MTVSELAEQLKYHKPTLDVLVLHAGDGVKRYFDIESPQVHTGNHGKDCVVIRATERKR